MAFEKFRFFDQSYFFPSTSSSREINTEPTALYAFNRNKWLSERISPRRVRMRAGQSLTLKIKDPSMRETCCEKFLKILDKSI